MEFAQKKIRQFDEYVSQLRDQINRHREEIKTAQQKKCAEIIEITDRNRRNVSDV